MEQTQDNKTQKKWYQKWWVIVLCFFFGIGLIQTILGGGAKPQPTSNTNTQQQETAVIFDLESLHGKTIDEVRSILGQPIDKDVEPTAEQIAHDHMEWYNSFEKNNYELLVTYDVTDRHVVDFFLPATTEDERENPDLLEAKLGIQDSTHFSTEAVKELRDPSRYTGIKVTTK